MTNLTDLFYKKGICYSITINPHDSLQFISSKRNRLDKFINYYNEVLLELEETDYFFMPEVSEPRAMIRNIGPRLHLHGTIRFNTCRAVRRFLIDFLHKISPNASIDLDVINDHDIWSQYITKQRYIMNRYPITNRLFLKDDADIIKNYQELFPKDLGVGSQELKCSS